MTKALGLLVAFVMGITAVLAQVNRQDASLTAWFSALEKPDIVALEMLMAPEDFSPFEYEIIDFDVKQNRKEFLASMPEWVGAISGGSIEYRIIDAFEGGFTALVCYHFPGGDFLAEEEIGVYDTRITGIRQTGKDDDGCPGF